MLDDKKEACRETQHRDASPRGRFHIPVERIDAGHERCRRARVRRHQGAMSKEVGLEDDQHECDESRASAKHLLCCKERQQSNQQRKDRCCHSGAEDDHLVIILKDEIASAQVGLGLEITVLQLRFMKVHSEQRNGSNHLHQRRVLRV